jgi:hypothetical protein
VKVQEEQLKRKNRTNCFAIDYLDSTLIAPSTTFTTKLSLISLKKPSFAGGEEL